MQENYPNFPSQKLQLKIQTHVMFYLVGLVVQGPASWLCALTPGGEGEGASWPPCTTHASAQQGKNYSGMMSFSTDLQWASPLKTTLCCSHLPMRLTANFMRNRLIIVFHRFPGFAFCQKTTWVPLLKDKILFEINLLFFLLVSIRIIIECRSWLESFHHGSYLFQPTDSAIRQ